MLDAGYSITQDKHRVKLVIEDRASRIVYLIQAWTKNLTTPQGKLSPIELSEKEQVHCDNPFPPLKNYIKITLKIWFVKGRVYLS
jgi:hypothetical protein